MKVMYLTLFFICMAAFSAASNQDNNTCTPGNYGPSCEGVCVCKNDGVCRDGVDGDGSCSCQPGFYGADCSGVCNCKNGASCADGRSGNGRCFCRKGFSGQDCGIQVDGGSQDSDPDLTHSLPESTGEDPNLTKSLPETTASDPNLTRSLPRSSDTPTISGLPHSVSSTSSSDDDLFHVGSTLFSSTELAEAVHRWFWPVMITGIALGVVIMLIIFVIFVRRRRRSFKVSVSGTGGSASVGGGQVPQCWEDFGGMTMKEVNGQIYRRTDFRGIHRTMDA